MYSITSRVSACESVVECSMRDLFSTVLLDAAVDVAQSSSGQHVGRLLVDQSVKVSFDLENVGESELKSGPSPAL